MAWRGGGSPPLAKVASVMNTGGSVGGLPGTLGLPAPAGRRAAASQCPARRSAWAGSPFCRGLTRGRGGEPELFLSGVARASESVGAEMTFFGLLVPRPAEVDPGAR